MGIRNTFKGDDSIQMEIEELEAELDNLKEDCVFYAEEGLPLPAEIAKSISAIENQIKVLKRRKYQSK